MRVTQLAIWCLGWLWWVVLPVRRSVARANLAAALPDAEPALLRRAVGSVAVGYLELLLRRSVDWQGLEAAAGGAVLFTAHLGPWDTCLLAAARRVPITVFLKVPSNPLAARAIERLRADPEVDLEPLPVRGSMDAARAALERGRLVVFVLDQRHQDGVAVPFFGRPAWTSAAFAAMVHRLRPRLYASVQWRDHRGMVHARALPLSWEVPDDRDTAIRVLTARTQRWIERRVRERPGDWWWLHRRWKSRAE